MAENVGISCEVKGNVVLDKNSQTEIKENLKLPEKVTAPITKGQKLGTLTYSTESETIYTFDIVADSDVEEISFGAVLLVLLNSIISL